MVTFTFYIACKVTNFLRHPTPVDRGFFAENFQFRNILTAFGSITA